MDSVKKTLNIKTEEEKQREAMRKYQRLLNKSIRDIDKEINGLKTAEKKIILEIKKSVRENQMGSAKIQAKNLVRNRKHVEKFHKMKAQLNSVALQITMLKGTTTMTKAMKGVTGIMTKMNDQMKIPEMNNILREFQKESEQLDLKDEIMGDTIDDALGGDDDEEESDDILNQVLDEIGVSLNQALKSTSQKALPKNDIQTRDEEYDAIILTNRLNELKKV